MQKLIILILMATAGLAMSCSKRHTTIAGYYNYSKPKREKFKFEDELFKNNERIDTNLVYFNKDYPEHWLKFYSNGKLFWGHSRNIPTDTSFAGRIGGYIGYYKAEDTLLTMEIYYTQAYDKWGYLIVKGNISGDTLWFYSDKYRGAMAWPRRGNTGQFTNSILYIKSAVPHQVKTPDW